MQDKGKGKGGGDDDDDDDIRTPIRPSAKALGKRRVVEAEEPDRKSPVSPKLYFFAFLCSNRWACFCHSRCVQPRRPIL